MFFYSLVKSAEVIDILIAVVSGVGTDFTVNDTRLGRFWLTEPGWDGWNAGIVSADFV